ncbi:MAG TPA: peptide chain release factor-like protein [bacterium]|nr:peptide chain release factor-like protein [bacterium]
MKKNEIEVFFYKSSGPGGQRKNKRETAVKIVHLPTGLTVRATEHRSQSKNKELAMERLEAKLEHLKKPRKKRFATKKPSRVRKKELESKKRHSEKKKMRRRVELSE